MIIITDNGVMTVWDGARLIHERQMTMHELAAHQVAVALAIRRLAAGLRDPVHDRDMFD